MQHKGSEAAEIGDDGLSGFGMHANLARQRQQLERRLEVDRRRDRCLWELRRAWVSPIHRLAELHIGAEAAQRGG